MADATESIDLVVIGSGATGTVAALTAAEGGARVIVMEKMRSLGGVSNFAEGMFAAESNMQRAQYASYSRDDAFKTMLAHGHEEFRGWHIEGFGKANRFFQPRH